MRGEGWSVKRIAAKLAVSPASVSNWVSDLELTSRATEHRDRIAREARALGNARSVAHARARRLLAQEDGRERAQRGDPLHAMGCMLYWAEGAKDRNSVTFVNSDADMLAFFYRFLRDCYGVQQDDITFSVNCHLNNGLSLDEIQAWWLQRLSLPPSCLRQATVNVPSVVSSAKRRTLPFGTGRLSVNSTQLVQSLFGAIQEYADIDRPAWIDIPRKRDPLASRQPL